MDDRSTSSNNVQALPEAEQVRCVACKQEIPAGASVCSICKSYQTPWKNTIQYFSGIVALAAIVITAATWVVGITRTSLFYRDDVRLISASTLGSAVVVNLGDGEVYISHLVLTMPSRSTNVKVYRVVFEERLPPGQFIKREFLPKGKIAEGEHYFVRGLSAAEFEDRIRLATNGESCFELAFFSSADPYFRELSQMLGPKANIFNVGGYLSTGDLAQRHHFSSRLVGPVFY